MFLDYYDIGVYFSREEYAGQGIIMRHANGGVSLAPIIISIISVLLAAIALGWNIFRDIILKARIRLSLRVMALVIPGGQESETKLVLSIVNFGPGPVKITSAPLLRTKRFLRKTKYAVLLHDYLDPLSAKFPLELEVGDQKQVHLVFSKDCFLKDDFTDIGVVDTFGRSHWTPRKGYKVAKATYDKWFRNAAG